MGDCRFLLFISREKAEERFDIWRLINEQRIARNEWSVSGFSTEQGTLRPTLALYRPVAERNLRARRFLRAGHFNSHDDAVGVRDDESLRADDEGAPRGTIG